MKITVTEGISVITFGNIPFESESSFILSIFEAAAAADVNIDMISKASVSTDRTSVGFTFKDEDMSEMLGVISKVSFYRPPLVSCGNVKFVIQSDEMPDSIGFAMKTFKSLNAANVTPILITTAVDEISVVVRESDCAELMRELDKMLMKQ